MYNTHRMCAVYQYLRETVLLKAAVCPRTQTRTGESQDDPEPASHEGMLAPREGQGGRTRRSRESQRRGQDPERKRKPPKGQCDLRGCWDSSL